MKIQSLSKKIPARVTIGKFDDRIGEAKMDTQIIIVLGLNFIISLIGTLAYSVRLVGVRTGKIAVSFALFNVLMLIS